MSWVSTGLFRVSREDPPQGLTPGEGSCTCLSWANPPGGIQLWNTYILVPRTIGTNDNKTQIKEWVRIVVICYSFKLEGTTSSTSHLLSLLWYYIFQRFMFYGVGLHPRGMTVCRGSLGLSFHKNKNNNNKA